jgi:hypothetical protein
MPYFDHELLCQIGRRAEVGVGLNNEEISFYRSKPKQWSPEVTRSRQDRQRVDKQPDAYVASVIEGCRQVGVSDDRLDASRVTELLAAEFADDRPELQVAIPVIARRLLAGE